MVQEIGAWLEQLGLGRYAEAFADNEVDLEALPHLSDEDLKEIGVALGPRRRILAAAASIDFKHGHQEPPVADEPQELVGAAAERRQLTVMFVDLVGSTEFAENLDPEDLRDLITAYQTCVAQTVSSFDGNVAKFMGDGVLCYFGWPRAHEDDAERAVRAGLALLQAVSRIANPGARPLSVRAGIATGLVVVGDLVGQGAAQEQAVVGETPNLAARLQGMAAPGQVVLPEATRRLLGDLFDLQDLGEQNLKGISEPVRAFSVGGERLVESRFAARGSGAPVSMFGRDEELGLLLNRWDTAKSGEGQFVLLTGEAGIGKSRITRALLDALAADDYIRIGYQCSPYHTDTALHPTIRHLTLSAGIAPEDSAQEKLDKLETLLGKAEDDISGSAPLLAWLLGLGEAADARYGRLKITPPERRSATLEALLAQLEGVAARLPVLFIIEDAHWIDPTTLELLDLSLDRIAGDRVLILVTARPSFDHPFRGQAIVSRLSLSRLGRRQIADIVDRITGGRKLPPAVMEEIVTKTDGVPLFVEELTKTVLETGVLKESAEGLVLEGEFTSLHVPSTLQDSLMARLDRLQAVKEVAQTAACIGRDFEFRLLLATLGIGAEELAAALEKLVAAEIVFQRGTPPDATYSFKHALLQDAAYESLLKSRRQKIHGRLVTALEKTGQSPPEVVAYHAAQAGLNEKAVQFWKEAGTLAMAQPAYIESARHLTNALEVLDRIEDRETWREEKLQILIHLAQAQMVAEGYLSENATNSFKRARKLLEATDQMELRGAVYYGTWIGPYLSADHGKSFELTKTFAQEADKEDAPIPRLLAYRMRAANLLAMGRFAEALESLDVSFEAYSQVGDIEFSRLFAQDPGVQIRCYRYLALWMTGYADQAIALANEANEISRLAGHTNTICYNNFHDAVLGLWLRDDKRLQAANDETLRLATEHGMILWRLYGALNDDLLRSKLDQKGAIDHMSESFENYHAAGCQLWLTFYKAEEAKELLRFGRLEEAQAAIGVALEFAKTSSERWADAELYRVEGVILQQRGDLAGAETAFERALEVARDQQARILELRAAVSLAKLWQEGEDIPKAKALLVPVYEWFKEGFKTADLQEASALLKALSA